MSMRLPLLGPLLSVACADAAVGLFGDKVYVATHVVVDCESGGWIDTFNKEVLLVELGADGLPRRNTHGGSDLRGVRAAAEKRGGTMTLHWENEWFTLRVLLPQKS